MTIGEDDIRRALETLDREILEERTRLGEIVRVESEVNQKRLQLVDDLSKISYDRLRCSGRIRDLELRREARVRELQAMRRIRHDPRGHLPVYPSLPHEGF